MIVMTGARRSGSWRLSLLSGWLMMLGLPLAMAALLVTVSPFYARVELWLQDAAQRLVAREQHFDDVLVVAIDEASLSELRPYLGNWPYPRDIYALVLDYLGEMQVRGAFFDILFADARAGDDTFRAALVRNPEARLAASALRTADADADRPDILARLAWPAVGVAAGGLPAMVWPAATLPLPLLSGDGLLPGVGLISFEYDADGALRRVPLLHRVGGHYLPSAVLAALQAVAAPPGLSLDGDSLVVGDTTWPVAGDGTVQLRYPANIDAVPTLPFTALAKAALGLPGYRLDPAVLRGKTLFIGTTALFSDHVNTPRGIVNGVQVLAIAYGALQRGLYLAPSLPTWNALLLLCGLLPVAAVFAARDTRWRWAAVLGGSAAAFAAILLLHCALLVRQQGSWLALPLAVALTGNLLAVLYAQHRGARGLAAAAHEEAEQQRQVLALVSHELKSPLATIDLALQNLARLDGLPSSVQARHQRIHRASRRLQTLIEGNLAADRLRRGSEGLGAEVFDLCEVVGEVVEAAERPGIAVERPPVPANVRGDRELMRIACANLIGNAIKFSPAETPILIALAQEGTCWELRVSDGGCGISADDQTRIFEPYVRADGARRLGNGLGLALVRQIVERHRGTVDVSSALGRGASFIVRLPAGVHS